MEVKDSLPSSQEHTNPSPKPPESRLHPSYLFKIQLIALFPYMPVFQMITFIWVSLPVPYMHSVWCKQKGLIFFFTCTEHKL